MVIDYKSRPAAKKIEEELKAAYEQFKKTWENNNYISFIIFLT